MDGLKFNKIAAGVICGGLLIMAGIQVSHIVSPKTEITENAYPIEVPKSTGATVVVAAPEKAAPILHLLADADIAAGEKIAKKCSACHTFNEGGPAKIGPNLWNVVGGKSAHDSGFSYSSALSDLNQAWSYVNLNQFTHKPKKWLPGTKMNFAGLKKDQDRANLIAWLRSLSPAPIALPTAEEIAAEKDDS